jgi:hypothetical protein
MTFVSNLAPPAPQRKALPIAVPLLAGRATVGVEKDFRGSAGLIRSESVDWRDRNASVQVPVAVPDGCDVCRSFAKSSKDSDRGSDSERVSKFSGPRTIRQLTVEAVIQLKEILTTMTAAILITAKAIALAESR